MENDFRYVNVSDILADNKYPFTSGQLRAYLLHRNENGLSKAIFKIGKRLVIRTDLFDKWIESQLSATPD